MYNCHNPKGTHYPLHCLGYLQEKMTLLNTVICIVPYISDLNNAQLTEILLYGEEDYHNINNTSILDASINNLIETKRFGAQLYLCSPDVMALTLILLLKFIFLFSFYYYYYLFILYIYFFISQVHHNIYMCTWWLQRGKGSERVEISGKSLKKYLNFVEITWKVIDLQAFKNRVCQVFNKNLDKNVQLYT